MLSPCIIRLARDIAAARPPRRERIIIPSSRALLTLVPIRPRWRGERDSLRTFPDASLRPGSLAFNSTATPSDSSPTRTQLTQRPPRSSTTLLPPGVGLRARTVLRRRHRRVRLRVAVRDVLRVRRARVVPGDAAGDEGPGAVADGDEADVRRRRADVFRCVLYQSFSPIAQFQHLIASPFN